MLHILLFLMLNISPATQSDRLFVASDSLFNKIGVIDLGSRDGWRFHPGDDLNWANPEFDDSDWIFYKPFPLYEPISDSLWNGYGWFRYRFAADSTVYAKVTNLYFWTYGAAEVYLDGKLAGKFGTFSTEIQGERRYMYNYKTPTAVFMQPGESHVLAVRFSYHKGERYKKLLGKYARAFGFGIGLTTDNYNQLMVSDTNSKRQFVYILGTMLLLIVLLHGFLFALFRAERSNLYIAIVASLLFLHFIVYWETLFFELDVFQKVLFRDIPMIILFLAALSMFPLAISFMFNQKPILIHKIIIWLFPVFALANFIISGPNPNFIILTVFASGVAFFSSRVLIQAWRIGQKGVWFVAGGFLGLIIGTVVYQFYIAFILNSQIEIGWFFYYIFWVSWRWHLNLR